MSSEALPPLPSLHPPEPPLSCSLLSTCPPAVPPSPACARSPFLPPSPSLLLAPLCCVLWLPAGPQDTPRQAAPLPGPHHTSALPDYPLSPLSLSSSPLSSPRVSVAGLGLGIERVLGPTLRSGRNLRGSGMCSATLSLRERCPGAGRPLPGRWAGAQAQAGQEAGGTVRPRLRGRLRFLSALPRLPEMPHPGGLGSCPGHCGRGASSPLA